MGRQAVEHRAEQVHGIDPLSPRLCEQLVPQFVRNESVKDQGVCACRFAHDILDLLGAANIAAPQNLGRRSLELGQRREQDPFCCLTGGIRDRVDRQHRLS